MTLSYTSATCLGRLIAVNNPKKPVAPSRVWRMSAEVPQGGFIDSVPAMSQTPTPTNPAPPIAKVLHPARVPSFRASSHDLLTGATVSDVTDTIPGDLFDGLFKPSR
jgi:hypothetical protein